MEKINNALMRIILVFSTIMIIWITLLGIINYEPALFSFNPVILVAGTIAYIVFTIFIYNKLIPKLIKYKKLPFILIGAFIVLCIVIGQFLKLNPTWDMGTVFEASLNLATHGEYEVNEYIKGYLYEYPNNIGTSAIYIVLFKIAKLFGITQYIEVATLFNSIVVGFTLLFMYLIAKKLFNEKISLMVIILALMTSPFYLYSAIYYSDTLAMLLSSMLLYFAIMLKDMKKSKIKIFLLISFGTFIAICYKVKITSLFVIIAYLIYIILNGKLKKSLKGMAIILISTFCSLLIINHAINTIWLKDKEQLDNNKIPIEYWLIVGLEGNGGFDPEIAEFIHTRGSYEEKQIQGREKIKEIIKNYDLPSFIKHINSKLAYAWNDGTYYATEKIRRSPVNKSILYDIFALDGKYINVTKYIQQSRHMAMLVLITIGCVVIVYRKKYNNKNNIFIITTLGFILFLLIWENRSRYMIPDLPFLIILQVYGIQLISNKLKKGGSKNEESINNHTSVQ